MANTHHDLPLEVSVTVVECNNWVDTHQQPCYVFMKYDGCYSLIQLTSPVSVINPEFPPHFVFPFINGISELSVVVSRDSNLSLSAIIGSVKISLLNVVSHGCEDSSWYLHKGSDQQRCVGAISLKLLCANTNDRTSSSSSSSRNVPSSSARHLPSPLSPHVYAPATYPSYGYSPPPHAYPQGYTYAPPPQHYHSHGAYNYPPTMAPPSLLQGLLTAASLTEILANLSQYLEAIFFA